MLLPLLQQYRILLNTKPLKSKLIIVYYGIIGLACLVLIDMTKPNMSIQKKANLNVLSL